MPNGTGQAGKEVSSKANGMATLPAVSGGGLGDQHSEGTMTISCLHQALQMGAGTTNHLPTGRWPIAGSLWSKQAPEYVKIHREKSNHGRKMMQQGRKAASPCEGFGSLSESTQGSGLFLLFLCRLVALSLERDAGVMCCRWSSVLSVPQ